MAAPLTATELSFLAAVAGTQRRPSISVGEGTDPILAKLSERGLIESVNGEWITTPAGDEALSG